MIIKKENFITINDNDYGIVGVGGDYSSKRLLKAYCSGIFPWPHGHALLWFCPDPRFVIDLEKPQAKLAKSLCKAIHKTSLSIKADHNFLTVIKKCQELHQKRHGATWINDDLIEGYYQLYQKGYAHSIEAYEEGNLVGGLYGVSLGKIFYGESMYFLKPNASKICLTVLLAHLRLWQFSLVDCQDYTNNLSQFGGEFIAKKDFLQKIKQAHKCPSIKSPWLLSLTPSSSLKYLRSFYEFNTTSSSLQ